MEAFMTVEYQAFDAKTGRKIAIKVKKQPGTNIHHYITLNDSITVNSQEQADALCKAIQLAAQTSFKPKPTSKATDKKSV